MSSGQSTSFLERIGRKLRRSTLDNGRTAHPQLLFENIVDDVVACSAGVRICEIEDCEVTLEGLIRWTTLDTDTLDEQGLNNVV